MREYLLNLIAPDEASNGRGGLGLWRLVLRKQCYTDGPGDHVHTWNCGAQSAAAKKAVNLRRRDTMIPDSRSSTNAVPDAEPAVYRLLVDSLIDHAVFAVSPAGYVMSWDAGAQTIFSYSRGEIIGQSADIIFTREDVEAGIPQFERSSALAIGRVSRDYRHVRKDGSAFLGSKSITPMHDESGALLGFAYSVRDVTAARTALDRLTDSEQNLRSVLESVPDYAIVSMTTDGRVTGWNAGAQNVFGYCAAEMMGVDFFERCGENGVPKSVPAAKSLADAGGSADIGRILVRKDGTHFIASGKLREMRRDPGGELRGFVNVLHDVTECATTNQVLRRRVSFDEQTRLPNRRAFCEHVGRALASCKRHRAESFAVLFAGIDHFTSVNDEFGHRAADRFLAATARRLEHGFRGEDIVARIGGAEFGILIDRIVSVADANAAAARIAFEVRQAVVIEDAAVSATLSVGICLGNPQYDRAEDLLRDAEAAMSAAKMAGGARTVLF
jgi:diguanylate cyclase (GGDEF)-like protein/PAS domain S-box-containing protein